MKLYFLLIENIVGFLRWRFPAILALMVLVGLTEGLSVTLLLPLFSHVGISYTAGQGAAGAMLHHALAAIGTAAGPLGLLFLVIGVAAFQMGLSVATQWFLIHWSQVYERKRRSQLFRAFMHAQWEFVIGRKGGELTNAVVSECERSANAFFIGLYLISTFIGTCIYLVFALLVAWQVTAGLIACAILMTVFVFPLYRKSVEVGKTVSPLNSELQSVLSERISGIKIVKATTSEDVAAAQVDRIVNKLERTNALGGFLPVAVRGLFEFFAFVALAAIFVFGEKGFGIAPGNVLVVFALFVRLFPRITTMQGYLHLLNSYLHASEVIDALQTDAEAHAEPNNIGEELSISLPTHLVLDHVDVKFEEHKVLDRIDLAIPVPGLVGIVGSSGAGKSTLVHTLLGLVRLSGGAITFGGRTLTSTPLKSWRRQIGYVPQETILFHASVAENMSLAQPGAGMAEIERAAIRAHAHEFIRALPNGYDTIIGDQGVKLSGGQRQRLGIARALLSNPKLLLLDEAMSALDTESEAEVLKTLEELRSQIGILIVAHRLSAVQTADMICVIEGGRVVETGTWNELMARQTRLFALTEALSSTDFIPAAER